MCSKKTFTSLEQAQTAMYHFWGVMQPGPRPIRTYQCGHCAMWHWTSRAAA